MVAEDQGYRVASHELGTERRFQLRLCPQNLRQPALGGEKTVRGPGQVEDVSGEHQVMRRLSLEHAGKVPADPTRGTGPQVHIAGDEQRLCHEPLYCSAWQVYAR